MLWCAKSTSVLSPLFHQVLWVWVVLSYAPVQKLPSAEENHHVQSGPLWEQPASSNYRVQGCEGILVTGDHLESHPRIAEDSVSTSQFNFFAQFCFLHSSQVLFPSTGPKKSPACKSQNLFPEELNLNHLPSWKFYQMSSSYLCLRMW